MNPPRLQRSGAIRRWLILAILAAGAAGAVLVGKLRGASGDYQIDYAQCDRGPIVMTVETLGTVEPLSTVTVGCETTGKIVEITVDHDEPVKQDQVICRIDPELMQAQHSQSEAELAKAKSALTEAEIQQREQDANLPVATQRAHGQLEDARATLIAAEYNWKRVDELFKGKNASETEWTAQRASHERAKAAVEIAEAAYEQAKLNETFFPQRAAQAVDQAKAALDLAQARFKLTEAQLSRCIIRSPIDGVVLKRYLDEGTTVNAAFQTPPLFLIAPNLSRLRVLAKVSESDIVHVEPGQIARFTVEGKRRVEFQGKILHKRFQPEVVQGVATYTVILEVDNDERSTLLPGMSVNVEIECVNRPDAVRISNKALRFKPPIPLETRSDLLDAAVWPPQPRDDDGAPALYCKKSHLWRFDEAAQVWQVVPIWIGITDNLNTEVLAGAAPEMRVVSEFIDGSSASFSLKEAIRLARPDNRTL